MLTQGSGLVGSMGEGRAGSSREGMWQLHLNPEGVNPTSGRTRMLHHGLF